MEHYTTYVVIALLRNYMNLREVVEGRSCTADDIYNVTHKKRVGEPPYSEPRHAQGAIDGKKKARAREDIHCAVIDLETALEKLLYTAEFGKSPKKEQAEYDLFLLYRYYILGDTLDNLMGEKDVSSRSSMGKRVFRAAQRLSRMMERAR